MTRDITAVDFDRALDTFLLANRDRSVAELIEYLAIPSVSAQRRIHWGRFQDDHSGVGDREAEHAARARARPNEHLHLDNFFRGIAAAARLYREIGAMGSRGGRGDTNG